MEKKVAIAIDGPAGAGKSTISKMVAQRLGIIYIDTGAMFRTVALDAIKKGIDTKNKDKIAEIIHDIDIKIKLIDGYQVIYLSNEDVSTMIRTSEVSMGASNVATVSEVRKKLLELQRAIASENSVVMDGRDIGTVVLPNANLKIFLTASTKERAERRYRELAKKGNINISLDEVEEEIKKRDYKDTTREESPLKRAEDAIEVDTTGLTIEEVVDIILKEIEKVN